MADEYVLWFDARCPASRRALELLRAGGVEPQVRRFLEEPPTPDELAALLAALGVEPHVLARRDADEYQALRLSEKTPASELISALCRHPAILERPIVVAGGRGVVGRPPERVEELLPPRAADAAARGAGPR